MSIVSFEDILSYLDVTKGYFTITAANDIIKLKYDGGASTDIEADDSTYEGDAIAAHLQAKIITAFGTGTVTYSSTTKKFTINAGVGHTIEYIHLGSDMGLTIGFNANHAAAQTITSNIAASDPSAIVSVIHNSVEDWVENYCNRKFEGQLHVKERYDGDNQEILYFKQYPVLAVNLDNLVWNSAGKTLTRADGGSFVDDGFTAADKVLVQNSDSNSGLLTIATAGVAALVLTFDDDIVEDTDDDNIIISHMRELWVNDCKIDEDNYEVEKDNIYYTSGFYKGHGNIRMTYYAGYSADKMPSDLQLAIKIIVKHTYQKMQEETHGVKNYKTGDMTVTYEDGDIPKEAEMILEKYMKWEIV